MLSVDNYYIALGVGKQTADPFLRFVTGAICTSQPTVQQAVFLAYWTVEHVIQAGPGGVGGLIRIGTLRKADGTLIAEELTPEIVGEQRQAVADATQALRTWRDLTSGRQTSLTDGENDNSAPPQRPASLGGKLV